MRFMVQHRHLHAGEREGAMHMACITLYAEKCRKCAARSAQLAIPTGQPKNTSDAVARRLAALFPALLYQSTIAASRNGYVE